MALFGPIYKDFDLMTESQKVMDKTLSGVDKDLPLAVAGAVRVRNSARLASLGIMLACAAVGGLYWQNWLIGALLGGLVVEINLSLLVRTLIKSASWKGPSLWPTLLRFYFTFGFTIVVCILVVRNHWGNPLAFLLGLLSFFLGLALGLISLALKKPKVDSHE